MNGGDGYAKVLISERRIFMSRKVNVHSSKTVYTYVYLNIVAEEARERAKDEEGSFYNCMTAELFSAFCLEAYLNHLGAQKIPYWESVEKKLGPSEKLEIICHEIGLKPDFGRKPFQSFRILFQLRNSLVHGKTEYLEQSDEQFLEDEEQPKLPDIKWKSLINLDMANQFAKDTKEIIETIHAKSGIRRTPFATPESGRWAVHSSESDQE
jgi:hypothetical protein